LCTSRAPLVAGVPATRPAYAPVNGRLKRSGNLASTKL